MDNCPTVANSNQADSNEDGVGDVCEVALAVRSIGGGTFKCDSHVAKYQCGEWSECSSDEKQTRICVDPSPWCGDRKTETRSCTLPVIEEVAPPLQEEVAPPLQEEVPVAKSSFPWWILAIVGVLGLGTWGFFKLK